MEGDLQRPQTVVVVELILSVSPVVQVTSLLVPGHVTNRSNNIREQSREIKATVTPPEPGGAQDLHIEAGRSAVAVSHGNSGEVGVYLRIRQTATFLHPAALRSSGWEKG